MMDAVGRLVGGEVPLTTLFVEPTIARLAIALRDRAKLPAPIVAAIHPAGTRPPLFFLHGDYTSGGFYCRQMATELGDDQPFYAVHPHGIDRGDVPPTIEAMAADRVGHLRREIANGPYLFAGHCAAGLVALEMARQLRAEGEDVPLVVIIDARAPARREFVSAGDGRAAGEPPPDAPQRVSRHPTTAAYGAAVARYAPADYAGRVTVFGSERVHDPRPHLGWGAIAAQVTSARIPGDHFGAITRHAHTLAAALRRAIDDALRAA
jgi:thioesterase domain-containing protein